MKALDIIDEHIIIRETVGYEFISNIDVVNLPEVIKFLRVVHNYERMKKIKDEINRRDTREDLQIG